MMVMTKLDIKNNDQGNIMTKRLLIAVAIASALTACGKAPTESNQTAPVQQAEQASVKTETERLNEWFEQKYEEELLSSPMYMTFLGRKDKYDQLDTFTEAEEDARFARTEANVKELKETFDYDKLTEAGKISSDIWLYQYEQAKAAAPYRRKGYIFTQMQGPHAFLPNFMINFHKVDEVSDMEAYVTRISGIATAIDNLLVRAKLHAEGGVRAPYFAYDGVIEQSKGLIAGAPFTDSEDDAPLWSDAKGKVASLVEAEKLTAEQGEALTEKAKQALLTQFKPSYDALIAWMEADKANVPEQAHGVGAVEGGIDYYNAQLLQMTTTGLKADEIHELGLSEVARLRSEMVELMKKTGFEGDLQAFFEFIKTDSQFFYPNDDTGRQGYIDDSTRYLDYIDSKLPEYFGILPKAKLVVKRVEAFREQPGAAQHYYPGSPDGSRPGVYYAHLSDMTSMPKNEMEAIAYHEGNPGHHMQISIAQELTAVPTFRTQASFTAYIEGWALYSELLAKEMGAYENDYSDFGRLVTEIWRAIRLVVDSGIHTKGWTEEQAMQYFRDNSPVAEGQIQSEVRRYFVWPGQATAYKVGMLKIMELRAKAEKELGDKFDIRGFHDTVLGGGAVPLNVLERMVDNWIAQNK